MTTSPIHRSRRTAVALTTIGALAGTLALGAGAANAAPVQPAGGITFPITSGRIDPATAVGYLKHGDGLTLSAGRTKVTLSDYNVVIGKPSTFTAKVHGGGRAKLLVPVIGQAKMTRSGLATNVSDVSLHLTSADAGALNKIFGVTAFKSEFKLDTLTIRTTPAEVLFAGGQTDLALDSGAAATLQSLGVTPGLTGGATANPDGSFAFPITGGKVNARSLAGTIGHSGGITLTKDWTTVALTDYLIDTTKQTLAASVSGSAPVEILSLDLSAPKVTIAGHSVTVGNVPAKLTKAAADALNQAFARAAFTEGLLLGVATVRGDAG